MTRTALHALVFLGHVLVLTGIFSPVYASRQSGRHPLLNQPSSRTHFCGTGSVLGSAGTAQAYDRALNRALADLASQITLTLSVTTRLDDTVQWSSEGYAQAAQLTEKVTTRSGAVLDGWYVHKVLNGRDGRTTVVVALEKQRYFSARTRAESALHAQISDCLERAGQGSALARISSLCKAEDLGDSAIAAFGQCRINGEQISVLLGRARDTLVRSLRIYVPADTIIIEQGGNAAPVWLICDGLPDSSLDLRYRAQAGSDISGVAPAGRSTYFLSGLGRIGVGAIVPLRVGLLVAPDVSRPMRETLEQIGATAVVVRRAPAVHLIDAHLSTSTVFANALFSSYRVPVVDQLAGNDPYLVRFDCDWLPGHQGGIHYGATALARLVVERSDGTVVLVWSKQIAALDTLSAQRARERVITAAASLAAGQIMEVL